MALPPVIWEPHEGSQQTFLTCPVWECLLGGSRGGGKGLRPSEQILTPTGWRPLGDLKEGHVICNPDGSNQKIIKMFPRDKQQMYRLSFSDGTVLDCDGDHLWFAKVANRNKGRTLREYRPLDFYGNIYDTETLYKGLKKYPKNRPLIPCPEPVKYANTWRSAVDAYLIGLLIGDGSLSGAYTGMTTVDSEIEDYITEAGFKKSHKASEIDYRISQASWVVQQVKALGLSGKHSWDKFIPERLLRGTVEERLSCLQGLMDSDGTVDVDGRCSYCTTSKQLADDTRQLILSLGGWATITEKHPTYTYNNEKKKGRLAYNLYIQFPVKSDLFRLSRKKDRAAGKDYMHGRLVRTIESIEKLDQKENTICIVVNNPNRLFITKDFVVTHNTDSLLMDFLQDVGKGFGRDYRGIIFRQSYTQLTDFISTTKKWIPRIFPAAKYNGSTYTWTFPDGEELLLRYVRTEDDYLAYHGHQYTKNANEFIRLADNSEKKLADIDVGDLIYTLDGPKRVNKTFHYEKPGVKVSVYDSCSNLIGETQQGVLHPVLTTAGWQRLGLSCLSETSKQSPSAGLLREEVQKFLLGVHQEIQAVSDLMETSLDFSISSQHRVQFSALHQILSQLPETSSQPFLGIESLFEIDPDSPEVLISGLTQENVDGESGQNIFSVQQLREYCMFLITLVYQSDQGHVHRLQSMLSSGSGTCLLSELEKCLNYQQFLDVINSESPQQFLQQQLDQNRTAWNDTFAYVRTLMRIKPNLKVHYSLDYDQDDVLPLQVLGTVRSVSPSQTDAQKLDPYLFVGTDDSDIQLPDTYHACKLDRYIHPYTHESQQTAESLYPLDYSVDPCYNPIKMVDLEIEDTQHYMTRLDTSGINHDNTTTQNDQALYLVDQNCFIGFEELSNWATPTLYLKLMSINRSTNAKINKKYRATSNPGGPGNAWIRKRFIDIVPAGRIFEDPETHQRRVYIASSLMENETLMKADPDYLDKLKMIAQDDPNLYKAWILGDWHLNVGGFFGDLWDKKIHELPRFEVPASWKVYRSFDWGSAAPWAVSYFAICNGEQPEGHFARKAAAEGRLPYFTNGTHVVIDEIYGWNGTPNEGDRATSQEIAERVLEKDKLIFEEFGTKVIPSCADTSIYAVTDGTSIGSNLASHGCHWTRAYKGPGSRVSGWALMRQMLGAAVRKDLEKPHLYFIEKAFHHIRTIPELQHDEKKPDDLDSLSDDHLADSLRYGISRKMTAMTRKKVGLF